MIQILSNAGDVGARLARFGLNIPVELDISLKSIGNEIVRRAGILAPKWSGELKGRIHLYSIKRGTVKIISEAGHSAAQEYGFKGHFVSTRNPKIRAWLKDNPNAKSAVVNRGRYGRFLKVGKRLNPKGYFMGPAVRSTQRSIQKYILTGIRKAWMKR